MKIPRKSSSVSYHFVPFSSGMRRKSSAGDQEACFRSESGIIEIISFRAPLTSLVTGRCITLHRPDIALHVLTERPRYRLDLDLNTARDLLHSIFIRATWVTPLAEKMADEWKPFSASHHQDALLVAGLYPHFGLGEATKDPVASALLMSMFASSRTNPTTDMPKVEGLGYYGDIATELGKDLLKNTRSKQLVHLPTSAAPSSKDQPQFLHRHQVWLDSELLRADVKKLLTKLGFDGQSLSSLGVSSRTIDALSIDVPKSS